MDSTQLTYDMFLKSTLTVQECSDKIDSSMLISIIPLLIVIILMFVGMFYLLFQNKYMSRFIKNEKLEIKFQKHKQNNKGLQ